MSNLMRGSPQTAIPQTGVGRHRFYGSTGGGPTAAPITCPAEREGRGQARESYNRLERQDRLGRPWQQPDPDSAGVPFEVSDTRHGNQRQKLKPSLPARPWHPGNSLWLVPPSRHFGGCTGDCGCCPPRKLLKTIGCGGTFSFR